VSACVDFCVGHVEGLGKLISTVTTYSRSPL
jgi:hypothetical protein